MHDDNLDRVLHIASQVRDVYCQVLGSASADPSQPDLLAQWQTAFAQPGKPVLRLAVLGFVVEGEASRWLSNAEISDGVGRALESDQAMTIAGIVTPWSRRP